MDDLVDQMYEWANGDQELMDVWRSVTCDEPFVSLADELDEEEAIPELNFTRWASTSSTTLPDGSEIGDTFTTFSGVASYAELNEEELPFMIEGLYNQSGETTQSGAQEMFAAASLGKSIEAIDACITALEGEIKTLFAEKAAVQVEISELEAAVTTAETAFEEAVDVEAEAAAELTTAVATEGAAVETEAANWWTVMEGIITGSGTASTAAAVVVAKQKLDQAQQKKKEAEESLKEKEDHLRDKRSLSASLQGKHDSYEKHKKGLQQKKDQKQNELEELENRVEAHKMIHKAIHLKLWFIKYWLATKKKTLSRPLTLSDRTTSKCVTVRKKRRGPASTLPDMKRAKTGVYTVKEGDGHIPIRVIQATDESERTFKNKEFNERYGGWNRIAVIWEHMNEPSKKLKSLETVKIWASNNRVSDDMHSQCGMWGVIGENAYEIALEAVGRYPKLYTFFENGVHTSGKEFQLETYDSIFLCIRSAPYPAWEAACHGFEVQYTLS